MARVAQTLPLISRVRRHIPVATMIFVADQKLKEEIIAPASLSRRIAANIAKLPELRTA
jgi:hypothetical protein